MLLPDLLVAEADGQTFVLHAPDNYSKLRAGDKVSFDRFHWEIAQA